MDTHTIHIKKVILRDVLKLGLAWATIASANAARINLQWNGNAGSLKAAFESAVKRAGNNGTVVLGKRTYVTNKEILINRSVTIEGVNRNQTKIHANFNGNRLFQIAANGVTFYSVELDGKGRVDNVINNFRRKGLTVRNSRVKGARNYNIGNATFYPNRALFVKGTQVQGGRFGIGLLNRRNTVTSAGNVEKITIENATITGFNFSAVEIDCANDLGNYLSNFNYTTIKDCFMNGPGDFCVGSTNTKHLIIEGNNLTCEHDPAHFEFRSRKIWVRRNRLRSTLQNGAFAGVALIPGDRILGPSNGNTPIGNGFRNPNPNNHKNGCRAIFVLNNTFVGRTKWGVLSVEAADCEVRNNNFTQFTAASGNKKKILLTDKAGSISGFGGSNASRGSKRFKINGNSGLRRSEIQFQNGVGHQINQ